MAEALLKCRDLVIEVDEGRDVLTIGGARYTAELFRTLGWKGRVGQLLRLERRRDGVVTVGLHQAPAPAVLLQALRFYASGQHLAIDDDHHEFDRVSGEPSNWLYSHKEGDCTMLETGAIAAMALRGEAVRWADEGQDHAPQQIDGEAFAAPSPAEMDELLRQLQAAAGRHHHLHATHQGTPMLDEVYDEFATLRDRTIPDLKQRIRVLAQQAAAGQYSDDQADKHAAEQRESDLAEANQSLRDMLDDAHSELTAVRQALGVPYEPHQSLQERTLLAASAAKAVPDGFETVTLRGGSFGWRYAVEKSAKLLRDIDRAGGLRAGGEQYPNGLNCLDMAQRLEDMLAAAPTPAAQDVPAAVEGS